MRTKKIIFLFLIFISFLMIHTFARLQVSSIRSNLSYRLQVAAAPIPADIMRALAGEFKGLVADYLLLEAASFIGGNVEDPTAEQWNAVAYLLEQSSVLDPYFRQTYILAQGVMPWQAKKVKETLTILERSKNHLDWDWQPGFFLGFDHFYFLKDNITASQEFMEASKRPKAPILLATLASNLASKAGQTHSAIEFLETMIAKTEDEGIRKSLEERILALKGVLELQQSVDRFQVKFGRLPNTLAELVEYSILYFLPENPYNRPYSYNNGEVGF